MKTQEEIEQLAEQYIKDNTGDHYVYCAYVDAYTQCQEDMTDKKYTEEDIRKAFDTGYYTRDSFGDTSNNMTAEEYIHSLNKQD